MNTVTEDYKGYFFSEDIHQTYGSGKLNSQPTTATQQEIVEIMSQAHQTLSSKLPRNDWSGAYSESMVKTAFQYYIWKFGLQEVLTVTGNTYSPKKYKETRGQGYDILISAVKKHPTYGTIRIPLKAYEIRNGKPRHISPYDFKHRILTRFKPEKNISITKFDKILLHTGFNCLFQPYRFSKKTRTLMQLYNIKYEWQPFRNSQLFHYIKQTIHKISQWIKHTIFHKPNKTINKQNTNNKQTNKHTNNKHNNNKYKCNNYTASNKQKKHTITLTQTPHNFKNKRYGSGNYG